MVRFSSRMNLLKGSAIRELLALANKPEILSFAGGMPAPELFPVDKIKAATDAVLEEQGKIALQYSSTNGFEHFRQQIADRMEAKLNIKTTADNILVTSGSQQGLDYSARVFCDKGDVVIIESPSYLGALNAFKACEPNFVAIPTDGDGMIMEELEKGTRHDGECQDDLRHPRLPESVRPHLAARAPQTVYGDHQQVRDPRC